MSRGQERLRSAVAARDCEHGERAALLPTEHHSSGNSARSAARSLFVMQGAQAHPSRHFCSPIGVRLRRYIRRTAYEVDLAHFAE